MLIVFVPIAYSSADSVSTGSSAQHTYIVTFKDTPSKLLTSNQVSVSGFSHKVFQYAQQHDVKTLPGTVKYNYNIINAVALSLTDSQLSALQSRSDIASIVPDEYINADLVAPSELNGYQTMDKVAVLDNVTPVWSNGFDGTGIKVCIIDSGVDTAAFPELGTKLVAWKDFLNDSQTPYDDYGHGTAMAGIIASTDPTYEGQYKGIAYGANIMSAKVIDSSGSFTYSDMIAALDWAVQNHANVVSMSLSLADHDDAMDQAVTDAVNDGLVVVCSAGNAGEGGLGTIKCPSDATDAITVGSVDINNVVDVWSSRGPTVDGQTKPDIAAIGNVVVVYNVTGTPVSLLAYPVPSLTDQYMALDGTSVSTAQVSGIAALLLQANPKLTPLQVKYAIEGSANRVVTNFPNNDTGWGDVDAGAALNEALSGSIMAPVPSSLSTLTTGAQYVRDTIPATMNAGESYVVSVTIANTGSMPWTADDNIQLAGTSDASQFGDYQFAIPDGIAVKHGDQFTFYFTITAPKEGSYNVEYQMANGDQAFGDSVSKSITVGAPLVTDAQFVSETIPATVAVGQTYTGTVTFENTGTAPWNDANKIRLALYGNTANMGINGDTADMWYQMFKIAPTTTVQPGETYTWTFSFTPTNAGDFWLGYSMANEAQGLSFFGQAQATSNTVTSGMLDAQFVSETIPATVAVGQTYTGTVTFKNTGTTPWDESSMIRLACMVTQLTWE